MATDPNLGAGAEPAATSRAWRLAWWARGAAARREAFALQIELAPAKTQDGMGLARMRAWLAMGLWGSETHQQKEEWRRHVLGEAAFAAARNGACAQVFELAVEAGLDPNQRDKELWFDTLLTCAVRERHIHLVAPLVALGTDPELIEGTGQTAIRMTYDWIGEGEKWDQVLCQALVDAGADINAVGRKEEGARKVRATPTYPILFYAARNGNLEQIEDMVAMGARLDSIDHMGRSIFNFIPPHRNIDRRRRARMISLLLKQGGKVDQPDRDGCAALNRAICDNEPENALALIEAGARLDMRDDRYDKVDPSEGMAYRPGSTLLHHLVCCTDPGKEHTRVLEEIEQAHPDCWQWTNALGETPEAMMRRGQARGDEICPFWIARAESRRLEASTPQVGGGRRRGHRL